MRLLFLRPRNPARCAQQLILPLAPLTQLGRMHGISTQVQKYLCTLAEALAGKGAGSVRNARAVGKQLPARRLTRAVSEQLILQHMWMPAAQSFSSSFCTVKRIWWERLLLTMAEA